MDCPVCFQECSTTKMVCGHSMCRDCITRWYQKGCNKDCPMCRKPICFRGLAKLKQDWDEKNIDDKYSDVLSTCIDEMCTQGFDDGMEVFLPSIMRDISTTFNVLRELGAGPDEIDYWIMEEGLYMSERYLKLHWYNEPVYSAEPVWRPTHVAVA